MHGDVVSAYVWLISEETSVVSEETSSVTMIPELPCCREGLEAVQTPRVLYVTICSDLDAELIDPQLSQVHQMLLKQNNGKNAPL